LTCGPKTLDCNTAVDGGAECAVSLTVAPTGVTGGGTCTASQVAVAKSPPTWKNVIDACSAPAPGSGCSATQACLPKPAPGFLPHLCIMKAGVNQCPPGQFQYRHVLYTAFADTRDCTHDCACGSATGGDCTATLRVYSTSGCTGSPILTTTVDSLGPKCDALTGNPAIAGSTLTVTSLDGGSCAPSGGTPTGAVDGDPTTAVTFCCIDQ
jgi:hypothetical protein